MILHYFKVVMPMWGKNYLAAFGTIFIFIGIFCLKSVFDKKHYGGEPGSERSVTKTKNVWIVFVGIIAIVLGIWVLLVALKMF